MSTESAVISRLLPWVAPATDAEWDALYAEQLPRVYNYLRYRVGNDAVAEDLTSMTFIKAWQARGRYQRNLASFSTWLFVIARNLATDHFRRQRPHAPLEAAEHLPSGSTPADEHERRAGLARLADLLAELSDRERDLLALKYGAGLTNRAIARHLGLSESNVGTIVHRTIETLRAGWKEGDS